MSVNRFTGPVGPIAGSIIIPLAANSTTSTATKHQYKLPAGVGFKALSVYARVASVTSDPSMTVGTTTAATYLVAAVNITTTLSSLTVKAVAFSAGATITAVITNDTGDGHGSGTLQLDGYFTGFPTAVVTAIERS